MGPKPVGPQSNDLFRQRLDELVNLQHPLARLAQHIDWQVFEQKWAPHFPSSRGRPATPTRLISGLLNLRHTFALSDEDVVWGWVENPYWVRRETGKAQVVKVHCDEGVANHIGPEPCVAIREGVREALVGEHAGQPWSHEMVYFPDADVLQYVEGNTYERVIASARRSGVVVEPGMHGHALRGNREISRLERVRQAAKLRKKERFTALLHHITVDFLEQAFYALRRKAAPGVDGQMWSDYEGKLEEHLQSLHGRIHSGAYKALPVRRRFILKADGKQRPSGMTALEDKIVQRAVVEILNAIYEQDFLGFSYGFRPGRGQHDALGRQSPWFCWRFYLLRITAPSQTLPAR